MKTATLPELEEVRSKVLSDPWEYAEADTKYLTHNIHRYSGKFIPQIADRAIQTLTEEGDLVLDPFCGSGTTLLEAAILGRRAIGIDLSPLAVLIARCKLTPVPPNVLVDLKQRLLDVVSHLKQETGSLFDDVDTDSPYLCNDPRLKEDWYLKWFEFENLRQLLILDHNIRSLTSAPARNIGLLCLSNILRRVSRTAVGYPNVMFDKNATMRPRPFHLFPKELKTVIAQVEELTGLQGLASVSVIEGDSTNMMISSESVDAIVTHPPYIGSIPYAEYGALSLKWLGCDPKALDKILTGGKRQSNDVVERFEVSFQAVLNESFRVLKPGRFMFLMVGNPIVRGQLIDLASMAVSRSLAAGFTHVVSTSRSGINRRANKMGDETLLFFRK